MVFLEKRLKFWQDENKWNCATYFLRLRSCTLRALYDNTDGALVPPNKRNCSPMCGMCCSELMVLYEMEAYQIKINQASIKHQAESDQAYEAYQSHPSIQAKHVFPFPMNHKRWRGWVIFQNRTVLSQMNLHSTSNKNN